MKIITLVLLVIFTSNLYGQYIDVGTSWTYHRNNEDSFPFPPIESRVSTRTITGDTTISNQTYLVMDGETPIREDGDKIYINFEGVEHLLYDFSLVAGDTLSVAIPYARFNQDSVKVRIDSTSTVTYNGVVYKTQYVNSDFADGDFSASWGGVFVQGLGSLYWDFFPAYGLVSSPGNLRCFSNGNGNSIKLTSDYDCNIVSDYYDVNDRWTYRQWGNQDPDPIRTYKIDRIEYDSTTNDHYKILAEVDINDNPMPETEVKLQPSHDKVYFLDDDNTMRLLYDFSYDRQVGDTITYYLPSNANLYDISSNGGMEPIQNPYQYVIDSIGSVGSDVYNYPIRTFDVTPLYRETASGEPLANTPTRILDGIGSMGTLIRRGAAQLLGGTPEKFICFNGSQLYTYKTNPTCDLTATNEIKDNSLYIYPNPASDKLQIENDLTWTQLEVYDINGQLMMRSAFKNEIDISRLSSGIYFLRLVRAKESVTAVKFVKL